MSSKVSMQLQSALIATGLVQPVSEKHKGGDIEVLCRQIPGQEKSWLSVVDKLLALGDDLEQDFHICRRYVRREGQMVFGWHIAFSCKNVKTLQSIVNAAVKVLDQARPSLVPAVEQAYREEAPAAPTASRAALSPGRHPPPRAASPRPPGEPGTVVGTPPATMTLRVVQNSRDEKGKQTIVEEMPLPHVYAEMNRPNEKGRGAKLTGGG